MDSMRSHACAVNDKREANPQGMSGGRRNVPMSSYEDASLNNAGRVTEELPERWEPAPDTEFESSRLRETMSYTNTASPHTINFRGNALLADTHSSLDLNFPDMTSHFVNGPNFDLNMVDLLQEANFDSLFDMVGQQYPSF